MPKVSLGKDRVRTGACVVALAVKNLRVIQREPGDSGSIHGSRRSPEEGNGNSL